MDSVFVSIVACQLIRLTKRFSSLALLMLLISFCRIEAQEVRAGDLSDLGAVRRAFDQAAEKQKVSDWIQSPYEKPGTQVRITFDPKNADVTLMTNRSFTQERLLVVAKQIAAELSLPETDYITAEGTATVTVDLEFNDYLKRKNAQSRFDLDLSALARSLERSSLPAPIVVGVSTKDATQTLIYEGSAKRALSDYWFTRPREVKPDTSLQFHFKPAWYDYPAAIALLGFFTLPILLPWWLLQLKIKTAKAIEEWETKEQEDSALPSPEEVQEAYNQQKPVWRQLSVFSLVLIFVFVFVDMNQVMNTMEALLPFSSIYLIYFMFGGTALSFGLTWLIGLKDKREPQTANEGEKEPLEVLAADRAPRWLTLMFIPMCAIMVIAFLPMRTPLMLDWRRYFFWGSVAFLVTVIPLAAFLQWKAGRVTLKEGFWHERVMRLAERAQVKVKRVVLVKSRELNGYASIFGTVGITQGLIDEMEPEEVEAVIAHELGHLKYRHPQKTLIMGLVTLFVIFTLIHLASNFLEGKISERALFALNNTMLYMIPLNLAILAITGRGRRQREHEADRFAVELTGDPELVIRSLARLHHLSLSPTTLKRSDELISTHPSLANRIEAIRQLNSPSR